MGGNGDELHFGLIFVQVVINECGFFTPSIFFMPKSFEKQFISFPTIKPVSLVLQFSIKEEMFWVNFFLYVNILSDSNDCLNT